MRIRLSLALLVVAAIRVHAQGFTLPQVLSYPYPLELVAAPSGARVAWVFDERGVRNIYEAHAPEWTAHRVTRYVADDGQELTQLAFSRDGATIVYVRGGDHDANWELPIPPGPVSPTTEPAVQIWAVRAAGDSAPRLLATGDSPAVAPTGDLVAFLRDKQAWSVPLAGGDAKQLFFARGATTGLAWAPDGSALAFVSDRGDHSFIGLYRPAAASIRWLAPNVSRDFEIRWSPDGKRLAFIRFPGAGGAPIPFLTDTPQPWAIWTLEVATGAAHELWHSPGTLHGNFPETAGDANLAWGAGDCVVFLTDVDGWPHLYSVPAAGGTPLLLTPGAFMVEHVAMSPDHTFLVYSANAGRDANDDDRRHIFRVSVDRANASALTTGAGIEWAPVIAADGGSTVFISAGPTRPPLPAVLALSGGTPRLIGADRIPRDFPTAELVVPRKVTFTSPDGLVIHGQLFETPGSSGKHAGVLFIHGGPPRQMMLGWHYMDYYSNAYAVDQYLASRGFVVMTVNYRLGIGYGHDFHHPAHAGPAGASEYQDVLAAGRFLASQPGVDPKRVGIWGGSYGGYLGALGVARNSDVFAADVDLHGVHDWVADFRDYLSYPSWQYERGDLDSARAVAWRSSPVASISTWKSPVLLIQGDDDRNVHFSETVGLARRLEAAGVKYEVLVLPDEIHGFLRYQSWLTADSATAAFLSAHLRVP